MHPAQPALVQSQRIMRGLTSRAPCKARGSPRGARLIPLVTSSHHSRSTRAPSRAPHVPPTSPARYATGAQPGVVFGSQQRSLPHKKIEAVGLLQRAKNAAASLLTSPYDKLIFSLAAPAIIALAADPLLAMVDTAIVGQLGSHELAALGVNNSLFGFAFVVFNFLSTATTPTVAAALSANDKKKSGETISQALLLASLLGTMVTVGLYLNADAALQLMGLDHSDPQLFQLAKDFLLVRVTAAPAALLVTVSQGVFRGLQDMRTPLAVTLATNLLHLGLSLAFIFPAHMGLSGAALSTSVAEWLAAGTYLYLGWGRRHELGMWPLPDLDPRKAWKQYVPFLQAGGAVLMRTAVLLGTKTLASAVATRLGPTSIASHQVLSQVWIMTSLIIDSLAISGQTMIAVSLGQGDQVMARRITDRLLQMGLLLGMVLSAALAMLGPAWPHLFTQDNEVLATVLPLLPIAVWMLPLNALVYVLDGAFVGASDFQFLVWAMVLASGGAAGLLLAVEPMQLGLTGVWGAQAVLMASRLLTLGFRYMSPDGPLPPLSNMSNSWSTDDEEEAAASVAGSRSGGILGSELAGEEGEGGVWSNWSVDGDASSGASGRSGDSYGFRESPVMWADRRTDSSASLVDSSASHSSDSCTGDDAAYSMESQQWQSSHWGMASSSSGSSVDDMGSWRGTDGESLTRFDVEVFASAPGCSPLPPDTPELVDSVKLAAPGGSGTTFSRTEGSNVVARPLEGMSARPRSL